jgi:hypothetical protein
MHNNKKKASKFKLNKTEQFLQLLNLKFMKTKAKKKLDFANVFSCGQDPKAF